MIRPTVEFPDTASCRLDMPASPPTTRHWTCSWMRCTPPGPPVRNWRGLSALCGRRTRWWSGVLTDWRSLKDMITQAEALRARGVNLTSPQESIDTSSPGSELIFNIFGSLAQFERDLIRERTAIQPSYQPSRLVSTSGPRGERRTPRIGDRFYRIAKRSGD